MLQTRINAWFAKHFCLLELDRGRRLTGAIVEHAVDVLDLIDDAAGDSTQHVPGHIVALGGHEVSGGDIQNTW